MKAPLVHRRVRVASPLDEADIERVVEVSGAAEVVLALLPLFTPEVDAWEPFFLLETTDFAAYLELIQSSPEHAVLDRHGTWAALVSREEFIVIGARSAEMADRLAGQTSIGPDQARAALLAGQHDGDEDEWIPRLLNFVFEDEPGVQGAN